ncbi:hypothetical protein GCM10010218_15410 [Streptomyces mashuensis]|uniref:DUF397 domain-containing protein n=1 Tax=Streptomyces mashuensis TaxID=33904 RepID=A0A919B208_9ACTN|nr:DUF397 domain-containing protein [Streptomyces mashuensis]GHF35148.1 hypothetical protein GCM10010218_15410 [Streptomyces mashuensis]
MTSTTWQKSSYSGDDSSCIYLAATGWQKSSFSAHGDACMYLRKAPHRAIQLRESDDPGVVLTTTPQHLHALLTAIKANRLR